MSFKLRYVLPAMPLTVPHQYKLLNYQSSNPLLLRYDYTTAKLARALRAGAEDELIKLDDTSAEKPSDISARINEKPTIVTPTVPSSLLSAPIYHPLTVFVSFVLDLVHSFYKRCLLLI